MIFVVEVLVKICLERTFQKLAAIKDSSKEKPVDKCMALLIYLVETSRSRLVLLSLYFTQWQWWRVVDPSRKVKDLWLD